MDRWKLPPLSDSETSPPPAAPRFAQDESAPCALFVPMGYEPGYAYPLLIWLHGPGADETQLRQVMPQISLRNYVAVAPRGTRRAPSRQGGFCWSAEVVDRDLAGQRVGEALRLAQEQYHVHPGRVFLAGFDTGGTLALQLALAWPERFAGVVSIAGALPRMAGTLRRWHQVRQLPILLMCGRYSNRYPCRQVRENLRLLFCAGLDVTVREYPSGQELQPAMLSDMNRWLMDVIQQQNKLES